MKINLEIYVLFSGFRFLFWSLEKIEFMIFRRICVGNNIFFKVILIMILSIVVFGKIYSKSDCLMIILKWKIFCLIKSVIINGIYIEFFWSFYLFWVIN